GDPAEDGLHVCQGVDGDADLAHLPQGERIVAVQAELGGEVEGQRQAGLPLPEEEAEALVGLDRSAEAGVLAHGPDLAPVHVAVDSARIGKDARRRRMRAQMLGAVVGLEGDPRPRTVEIDRGRGPRLGPGTALLHARAPPTMRSFSSRMPARRATTIFFHSTRSVAASTISSPKTIAPRPCS